MKSIKTQSVEHAEDIIQALEGSTYIAIHHPCLGEIAGIGKYDDNKYGEIFAELIQKLAQTKRSEVAILKEMEEL